MKTQKKNEDKTYRDWFNELPDGWRQAAFKNCALPLDIAMHEPCLAEAIRGAFFWDETQEGRQSWDSLYTAMRLNSLLPFYPGK